MYKNTIKIGMSPGYLCKLLVIMKLTTFIILISLMQVSASTFGQKMTLVDRSVSIEKVLMEVRKQTGYDVLIIDTKFDLKKRISADFNAAPLEQVMDRVVSGTDFTYKIDEKNVVLKQKEKSFLDRMVDRFTAIDVRGSVVDENGNALPGASVKVKGVNKVAKTDAEGEFYLQSVDESAVLEISYVGYKAQEVKAGLNLGIIKMELGDSELDEVMVSGGYYTTTNKLKTGSISKVTSKEIENQPVTSPLLALQGRLPGVEISPTSGTPGSALTIQIRGQNSLRTGIGTERINGNLPLYIIDGNPITSSPIFSSSESLMRDGFDPLSTINPNDIESIDVLKDADATAIYGSRGANGVIIIKTKHRKKTDQFNVHANIYEGIGKVVNRVEMLSTEEYLMMRNEAIRNDSLEGVLQDPSLGPRIYPDLLLWDTTRFTDWQHFLLGNHSNITDANLSLSGGNQTTSYNFGVNYHHETLLYPGDFGYKRYTGNLNINHLSPNEKLAVSLSVNFGNNSHKVFNSDYLFRYGLNLSPNAPPLYDENNQINWAPVFGSSTWTNPLTLFRSPHQSTAHNLITNGTISYLFKNGFSFRLNSGFTALNHSEKINTTINSMNPNVRRPREGKSQQSINERISWILEPQVNFDRYYGNHRIIGLIGATAQQATNSSLSLLGNGYTSDATIGSLSGAKSLTSSSSEAHYRYFAAFARIGYEYNKKY
ncbi:MAG: SusC/RagA family TonB-linked outer membrane protein, partial [Sphingobacteriales bacterium]